MLQPAASNERSPSASLSRARLRALIAAAIAAVLPPTLFAIGVPGCGNDTVAQAAGGSSTTGGEAGVDHDGGPVVVTLYPDAAPLPGETTCKVVITTGITETGFTHLPLCTPVAYGTNPPSGGDHWAYWAAYGKYTTPVPRQMYVHDEEHGGVVVAYRCESGCAELADGLGSVVDHAVDTYCAVTMAPPRYVLTPDPLLDTPIGVASWGSTYTATCLDPKSLGDFMVASFGHGREMICGGGYDPAAIEATCADAGDGG